MYQSGSLQYRQLERHNLKQGSSTTSVRTHTPQRTVGRMFHCRSTSGHNEKIQGSHRTRITEESYPNPGRGNSNQRGNHNPAASRLGRKTGRTLWVHAFQIYTHKDEGANVWDGKEEAWKTELSCDMIFDWTDGHTGKTVSLNRHDMAEMQTITAECLNMERGVSSDKETLVGHAIQKNKWKQRKLNNFKKTSSN
ncbi:hypothetical protein NXX54_26255 [Bacteroides sp. BFG-638]|nr:hypothetical protein [Bacteroides sp. BFG-638]